MHISAEARWPEAASSRGLTCETVNRYIMHRAYNFVFALISCPLPASGFDYLINLLSQLRASLPISAVSEWTTVCGGQFRFITLGGLVNSRFCARMVMCVEPRIH